MAQGDSRRIPVVKADDKGVPSLQGINEALRLISENVYKMEGRVGEVPFRDAISIPGDVTSTGTVVGNAVTSGTLFTLTGPNGSILTLGWNTESINISISSSSSASLLPVNSLILSVASRVTTALVGTALTFGVGSAATDNLFSLGLTKTLGTTDPGILQWKTSTNAALEGPWNPIAQVVKINHGVGTLTSGVVEVVVYYLQSTPPTS